MNKYQSTHPVISEPQGNWFPSSWLTVVNMSRVLNSVFAYLPTYYPMSNPIRFYLLSLNHKTGYQKCKIFLACSFTKAQLFSDMIGFFLARRLWKFVTYNTLLRVNLSVYTCRDIFFQCGSDSEWTFVWIATSRCFRTLFHFVSNLGVISYLLWCVGLHSPKLYRYF